jgi:hypothetical protein
MARCFERRYRRSGLDGDRNDWIAQLRSNQEFYRNTQDAFWQTTVENSSGNARKLWNSISAIMGSKKHSPAVDGLNAGIFLKTFEDKVKDVRASTEGSVPAEYSNFIGDYLTRFSEVSLEDVEMLIRKSSNKSCGLDPAPTWLIRDFAVELAPFICALFNKSLSLGSVPRSFKIADITPVLKKSSLDASVPSNYRPISNLCYLSKLLERIVNNQLVEHLQVNDLMPEHQSAYRRCHSTETALLKLSSDVLMAADSGMVTLLAMLDLSAAFDCVDHRILLTRLDRSFGVSGNALDWIRSYLHHRTQRVRYNGQTSAAAVLEFGVPQGSVLGPLYFLLYTADVFHLAHQNGFKIHGYADDLQLYNHCLTGDMGLLSQSMSSCIDDIRRWMLSNRLRLNSSKTEVIWLGSGKRLTGSSIEPLIISGSIVQPTQSVRNLGVIFDSSMSFANHSKQLAARCYYHLRQIRGIRRSLTVDSCHALVRALILSRLDYCNGLLSGVPDLIISQLDGVLRAAARVVLQQPRRGSITSLMRERLHWLDVSSRIRFKLCVLVRKCLHDSVPTYIGRMIAPVSMVPSRSNLRSSAAGDLLVPRFSCSTFGPRAFAISAPRAWNSLPPTLKCDDSALLTFRKKLKTFLFNASI